MNSRNYTSGLRALAGVFAATLLSVSAFAQIGLTGNALSGQAEEFGYGAGQFDRNYTSKSALGQLEEMTGSKVDRSSGSRNTTTRSAPQSRPAQPRYNANQMLRQEMAGALAGALVGALFANIFNDNSAQQKQAAAEAAAAQAAAQAEAFRVQQELAEFARKARIKQAQRYRAEWDAREAEVEDRLGGAFNVGTGTAFFGQPAGPNADVAEILSQVDGGEGPALGGVPDVSDADASVVDLQGSSGVVQLFTPPVRTWSTGHVVPPLPRPATGFRGGAGWIGVSEPPPPPSETDRQLKELIAYFGPALGKYYWETVIQGTAKATFWGRIKDVRGMKGLAALVGFEEQRESGIEELGDAYTESLESTGDFALNVARVVSDPYNNGEAFMASNAGSLDYQVRKLKVKFTEMLFQGFVDHTETIDLNELKAPPSEGNMVPINGVSNPWRLHLRLSWLAGGGL